MHCISGVHKPAYLVPGTGTKTYPGAKVGVASSTHQILCRFQVLLRQSSEIFHPLVFMIGRHVIEGSEVLYLDRSRYSTMVQLALIIGTSADARQWKCPCSIQLS